MNTKLITLQFLLLISIFTTTSSSPSNFTLYGTAHINQTTITLTQTLTNCSSIPPFPNTGRIFFKTPIQFQDSDSFSTRFTFIITPPPPPCLSGEGIAFFITPHINSLPYSAGSIGLPITRSNSFLAVEFDTNLDQVFNDINDNHVGVDLNSVVSIASVDLASGGVELTSGKPISSWIEYNNSKKVIGVWVGYDPGVKPDNPVLTAPIDLSKRFHGFVYVGFTGSNGKGSSVYSVSNWEFKTFGSGPGSGYPDVDVEEIGLENCMICFPEVSRKDPGLGLGRARPGSETKTGLVKNRHTGGPGIKLAIGLLVVNLILVFLMVCSFLLYMCLVKKHGQSQGQSQSQTRTPKFELTNTMPRRMKLSEIRSATKGFNRNMVIGDGVSSVVYKTDRNMAVKRFKTASFGSQIVTDFVTTVGSLQHKNLMKIRGWCCERSELIIVYDYMPNGALDKVVRSLSFETRLNVLIGVSSALIYLHEEFDRLIVHRNVKSSNILLDSDFTAKLGDFEMGEFCVNSDLTRDVTVPARAMGYLAPEYVYSRVPTVKTDVYSFGVVVLEVASGRPAVGDNGVAVTDWVWDLWEEKKLLGAADGNLDGKFDRMAMEMMLMVGLICVHPNYRMRPSMKEVLRMLKGEVVPNLPDVKPTVIIQSVSSERSPEVVVKCGGDEVGTSWGTPTSHFD